MNDRWLGVPLPIWILAMAAGVYVLAHRASTGMLPVRFASGESVVGTQNFTTPPNQISQNAPQATGGAPGTAADYSTLPPVGYNPGAPPPTEPPSFAMGVNGPGRGTWKMGQFPSPIGGYQNAGVGTTL